MIWHHSHDTYMTPSSGRNPSRIDAKQLPPAGSLRPLTFYTLFGLVAACGLRISEALALQIDDIRPDGLYIRETKFRKSRLVPLHPTTEKQLIFYLDRRQ